MELSFVTCVNHREVLERCLLTSPCLAKKRYPLALFEHCTSAAEAFNAALKTAQSPWLVFVHQDVVLPEGWDRDFLTGIATAQRQFDRLAVVGVYGIGVRPHPVHLGHVLDRGHLLVGSAPLPALADTLDELCFAVRCDAGLALDAALGFDFYAADLALQARQRGFSVAVVEAYCEHHSALPRARFSESFIDRFTASATIFQEKWRHRLPITTPCITLTSDVAAAVQVRAAAKLAG